MKSNLKTVLIAIVLILIPVTIYVIVKLMNDKNSQGKNNDKKSKEAIDPDDVKENITNWTQVMSTNDKYDINPSNFPLKINNKTKSKDVLITQKLLNKYLDSLSLIPPYVPYDKNGKAIKELVEDGFYGDNTAAVIKFLWPETTGNQITLNMFYELTGTTNQQLKFGL